MGAKAAVIGIAAGLAALPVKADPFAGFYAGLIGGYSWQKSQAPINQGWLLAYGGYFPFQADVGAEGASIGGIVGYGSSAGEWYVGVEADFSYAFAASNYNATKDGPRIVVYPGGGGLFDGYALDASSELNWYSTARARVGWHPGPSSLIYGTFGVATVDYDTRLSLTYAPILNVRDNFQRSGIRFGPAVGAGFEYAISGRLKARAEYLYVHMRSFEMAVFEDFAWWNGSNSFRVDPSFHTARIALTYGW